MNKFILFMYFAFNYINIKLNKKPIKNISLKKILNKYKDVITIK